MFETPNGPRTALGDSSTSSAEPIEPFLKWAGGKRWLFRKYRHLFPEAIDRLIDPFLGGGASFFHLCPKRAILCDVNSDIVDVYLAIKNNPRGIAQRLIKYQKNHSKDYYYETRRTKPEGRDDLAAWVIYLNRTCWNGLYRVNLNGVFNVPIGTKTRIFAGNKEFVEHASTLAHAELHAWDFERTIDSARRGDVIFADPPYFENGVTPRFVRYNPNTFGWADQERLKRALSRARRKGARVYLTNSNHSSLLSLYSDRGKVHHLVRHSVVSGRNNGRGPTHEILIEFK